jgi:DNA-directed RNA polymerase specialized sigma24 family protein
MAEYDTLTDRELAVAAGNGDQRGLATLYDRYFAGVYDLAVRTLRDADLAADVVQQTFVGASRELHPGTVPENVKAWLYGIAFRRATDGARRSRQPPGKSPSESGVGSLVEIDAGAPPELQAVRRDEELRQLVWGSATELSPRDYALLDLNLRRGLSTGEVAVGIGADSAQATLATVGDSVEQTVTTALLIRRGRRDCHELAGLLDRSTASETSVEIRQAVLAHAQSCSRCQATIAAYTPPAAVLAGFAPVPAPGGLKEVIWGNVVAAISTAATAPTEARRGRRRLLIALLLAAAATIVAVALAVIFLTGGGDGQGDPDDIRSTSHDIGEASPDPVVRLVWSRQEGVLAYSVSWSTERFELPDEVGDLSGDATDATSPELTPGDWYFHLRTQQEDGTWTDTVHIGPFRIVEEATPTPTAEPTPSPTEEPTPSPTPTEEPTTEPTPEPDTETPQPDAT